MLVVGVHASDGDLVLAPVGTHDPGLFDDLVTLAATGKAGEAIRLARDGTLVLAVGLGTQTQDVDH